MAINIATAGLTGTHSFSRVNVNTDDDYLYFNSNRSETIPAGITDGTGYLYSDGTGSIGNLANQTLVFADDGPNASNDLNYSFAEVSGPPQFQLYWNPSMAIDKEAFDLASTLDNIRVPVWIEYLLTLLVIPAWFLLRRSGMSLLLVSALLSQAAFSGASWMLVGMRHKEEVSILPINVLAYSLVIFAMAKCLKGFISRKRNKVI